MSLAGIGSYLSDAFLPDPPNERLIFRKFSGQALADAAESNGQIKDSDVVRVRLKVNPDEIQFTSNKVINKVPTNAPGRYIVYDWGNDLKMLSISGNTGNLIPESLRDGLNPQGSVWGGLFNTVGLTGAGEALNDAETAFRSVSTKATKALMKTMGYFDFLEMSPKYKTLKRLEEMYELFDADKDVLTLEMGNWVYRGYFTEFRLTVSSSSIWNWKYNLGFVVVNDLAAKEQRDDDPFPSSLIS